MIYKEILKLKVMLEEANIPFDFEPLHGGYILIIRSKKRRLYDCIEHMGSYGNEQDKLEIMGALTREEYKNDSVLGDLSAEEVFRRFKYCYEHNTSIYVESREVES